MSIHSFHCGDVCSTKNVQDSITITTTKVLPPNTITTTTSKIPPSISTSSSSIKCPPVYVTITEKETDTIKETVTVTVKYSTTPTSIEDDCKCADKWSQCEGEGFTGPTCCKSGYKCHKYNKYYSQCI